MSGVYTGAAAAALNAIAIPLLVISVCYLVDVFWDVIERRIRAALELERYRREIAPRPIPTAQALSSTSWWKTVSGRVYAYIRRDRSSSIREGLPHLGGLVREGRNRWPHRASHARSGPGARRPPAPSAQRDPARDQAPAPRGGPARLPTARHPDPALRARSRRCPRRARALAQRQSMPVRRLRRRARDRIVEAPPCD